MKVNITITKEELRKLIDIANSTVNPKELTDEELALIRGLASTLDKDPNYSIDNYNSK